ncbi:MAG: hypothetical protein ACM3SS_00965 [Rhodospirillaceae bacterium]
MKARRAMRAERRVRFDPEDTESEADFLVDWEETDPVLEEMDAREAATLAYGSFAHED